MAIHINWQKILSFSINLEGSMRSLIVPRPPWSADSARMSHLNDQEKMQFTLKKAATTGLRLGEVSLGSYKAATPSLLVSTSRLAVPHITLDRFRKIVLPEGSSPRIAGIIAYADKLFENPKLVQSESLPTLKKFACLEDFPVFLGLESGNDEGLEKLKNGKDFITVTNSAGSCKVPIQDYAKLCEKMNPDVLVFPHDRVSPTAPPKHITKAVTRSREYIKLCKDNSASVLPTMSPLMSGEKLDSNSLASILINVDETSVKDATKAVFENDLRYARGPYTPVQIVAMAKDGVDLFDTSYVDIITNQHKAILIDFSAENLGQFELLSLEGESFFEDLALLDPECGCLACSDKITRSYIHHLVKTHEMLATVHLQAHNLHQFIKLLETIRAKAE